MSTYSNQNVNRQSTFHSIIMLLNQWKKNFGHKIFESLNKLNYRNYPKMYLLVLFVMYYYIKIDVLKLKYDIEVERFYWLFNFVTCLLILYVHIFITKCFGRAAKSSKHYKLVPTSEATPRFDHNANDAPCFAI